jgi:hypothetical protein
LNARDLKTSVGGAACDAYLAALYSEKFFVPARASGHLRLYGVAYAARALFLAAGVPLANEPVSYLARNLTPLRVADLDRFNTADLDEYEVWLWSGWPSTSRRGLTTCFPLISVCDRLSRNFVERLYALSDEWFAARHAVQIPVFRTFCELIRDYDQPICDDDFLDSEFITDFWRTLFKTHFIKGYADGTGSLLGTLRVQWEIFHSFVENSLVPGQLVAPAIGPFPRAPRHATPQLPTNRRRTTTGTDISTKLLTHVPLQISDDEAVELLFRRIETDLNIVYSWATREIQAIWEKYERRDELAEGFNLNLTLPRKQIGRDLSSDQKLHSLAYAAAFLRDKGYMSSCNGLPNHGRIPLKEAARELGLPTAAALLPHCIVLAREHPAITPSFLENFELFNKNGQLTGFTDDVEGAYLVGVKRRRGAALAQQTVQLNAVTREVVVQMIALTASVRAYMQGRGDDRWRYFLLTTGIGFGEPRRVMRLATLTSDAIQRERIVSRILALHITEASRTQVTDLVQCLSLPAVRASSAVLRYLSTHSVHEMSHALGHADYDPTLLNRYLPEPLRRFFQERWIRLLQNGVILESMKGSPHAVEASDFESLPEVDEFLRNHALKLPSDLIAPRTASPAPANGTKEIVFGLDTSILTLMLSIRLAVDQSEAPASEVAVFWAEVTRAVEGHIEAGNTRRPDLQSHLRAAKRVASATAASHLVRNA